jgi:hypothetical protein
LAMPLLLKNTAKYFLMQHNSQEYVASKEVKKSQTLLSFLEEKTSEVVNGTKKVNLKKLIEDDNLLEQYIRIQEASLLIGNKDAHYNNILLKKNKDGKLNLIPIDFDNEYSNLGFIQYNQVKKALETYAPAKCELIQKVKDELQQEIDKPQQLQCINFFIGQKLGENNTKILPPVTFRNFIATINLVTGQKIELQPIEKYDFTQQSNQIKAHPNSMQITEHPNAYFIEAEEEELTFPTSQESDQIKEKLNLIKSEIDIDNIFGSKQSGSDNRLSTSQRSSVSI